MTQAELGSSGSGGPDYTRRPMNVAFVTVYDPYDRDGLLFNPVAYWMLQSMTGAGLDVDCVGPLKTYYRYPIALKKRFYSYVLRQRYYPWRDPLLVRAWGKALAPRVQAADVVLSGMSPGSQPIAYLETDRPIVIWTDGTFAAASKQDRENLQRLAAETRRTALANEAAALGRCALALYWSEWAARSAREHYGLDETRVRVLPAGPAMQIDHSESDVESFIASRPDGAVRLLLVGNKWRDKGCDVAIEAAAELNRRGISTELHIVGVNPPEGLQVPEFVHLHGFLRKSRPDDDVLLRRLYRESHFLILPTRAEAFGMVFCEASAFGVPSLASDVGGVPSAIRDGVNGHLLPLDARGVDYADAVEALAGNRASYEELGRSSFAEYRRRLSWETIGAQLKEMLEEVTRGGSPGGAASS